MNLVHYRIAIIADDLTGAMDGAVPFASRGLRVVVLTDIEKLSAVPPDADVVAISTDSRHCTEPEAIERVLQAFARFSPGKPKILIKKIDSTLRGNAAAESCALLAASGRTEGLVCPAVPAQKRAVVDGMLLVGGVPLADTAFSSDLRSKARMEPLPQLFHRYAGNNPVRLEQTDGYRSAGATSTGAGLTIADAVTDTDLQNIVKNRLTRLGDTLFIGASGLTSALATSLYGSPQTHIDRELEWGHSLFVVGSVAPESREQLDTLRESGIKLETFVLEQCVPVSESTLRDLPLGGTDPSVVLVKSPSPPADPDCSPAQVVYALGESTRLITASCDINLIIGTGGDTVQGVLERLGIDEILVHGEVAPGVVHGSIETSGKTIRLVTKAGGFGEPDLFLNILEFFHR